MREQASTPHGWACSMAVRTLSASRPPAMMIFCSRFGASRPVPCLAAAARDAVGRRIDQHRLYVSGPSGLRSGSSAESARQMRTPRASDAP